MQLNSAYLTRKTEKTIQKRQKEVFITEVVPRGGTGNIGFYGIVVMVIDENHFIAAQSISLKVTICTGY